MADIRETSEYKAYQASYGKYESYSEAFSARGALWFQLETQESQPETAEITIHSVTAKKQRWREIHEPSKEIVREVSEYISLNIDPIRTLEAQAQYNFQGENLVFIKDTYKKASDFIKSELKILEELVANVRKYPTLEKWNAYKDAVKDMTGANTDDLGEAKKGVIANAKSLLSNKTNLMIVAGVIAVLVYFMFIKKGK